MIRKDISFEIDSEGLYTIRFLRNSQRPIGMTILGRTLEVLLKHEFHIIKRFSESVYSGIWRGTFTRTVMKERSKIHKKEPDIWKEVRTLCDLIQNIVKRDNGTGYFQICDLGLKPVDNLGLSIVPMGGTLDKTRYIDLSKDHRIELYESLKYSYNVLEGTGLYVSPEKPIIVKRKCLKVKDASVAGIDDVVVSDVVRDVLECLRQVIEQGEQVHLSLR